jgi:hypothetical protein
MRRPADLRTIRAVKTLTYALQFRGVAADIEPGVLRVRASAPGGALTTVVGDDGVRGRYEGADGDEALLEALLTLRDERLEGTGWIRFSVRHALHFRMVGGGLTATPDEHLRQGAAIAEVDGGTGQFANASGRITSNFVLSDTGEVTDHQVGLVFVELDPPDG